MKINEIFYSIQGEGKWMGLLNIFIRTTGCNLRCSFCDTKYAYNQGKEKSISEIIKEISQYKTNKICLTGGEPLLQKDIYDLLTNLFEKKYNILIETNGSIDISPLLKYNDLIISLDVKCPSSKMSDKNLFLNIEKLRKKDQIKFVISDKSDYEYAKDVIKKYEPNGIIYIQPVWKNNLIDIANWIKKDNLNVRLGIQLHKIIWSEKKGV